MNHIDLTNKTILVTGSAGFIGSNLVLELIKSFSPITIIGIDNMNDYYDVSLKEWRLKEIEKALSDSTFFPKVYLPASVDGASLTVAILLKNG